MAENKVLFGVRYPDGALLPVSSRAKALAHVTTAKEHSARRVSAGGKPLTDLRVQTCEQTPWVDDE